MAEFTVFLNPTTDPEKPSITIAPKDDWSATSAVHRYANLQQLKDALLSLGANAQDIDHDLGKVRSREEVNFTFDITHEQAKWFGWEGNP